MASLIETAGLAEHSALEGAEIAWIQERQHETSRLNHSVKFKAKVALAAIKGEECVAQLAERFDIHLREIAQWKTRLPERASDKFASGVEVSSAPEAADFGERGLTFQSMLDRHSYRCRVGVTRTRDFRG